MTENIVRLSNADTCRLYSVLHAHSDDAYVPSLRVCTGKDNRGAWFKFDLGNTGWTPPLYSTDPPVRVQGMRWFINEDGGVYDYPAEYQAMVFPNDDHTPYATEEEAQYASDHFLDASFS